MSSPPATRRSHDRAPSPISPSEPQLRPSKSQEFLQTIRRRVSMKNVRQVFKRSDDSEHPWLRPDTPGGLHTLSQPTNKPQRARRIPIFHRTRGSSEAVPPMPRLPREHEKHDDEQEASVSFPISVDELHDMDDILDRSMLYNPDSGGSSPDSGLGSSNSNSGHSRSHAPFTFPPFSLDSSFNGPRTRSPEPIGAKETSHDVDFTTPDSWYSRKYYSGWESEEPSSEDDEPASKVIQFAERRWRIRIYGPDNTEHLLRVSSSETVGSLMPQLTAKLPSKKGKETHELYLKERGRERKLGKKERPATILRRCLQRAGYDETDGYMLHSGSSMTGVPFLLKFIYRSEFLESADDSLSSNNFKYVDLTRRSLGAIPIALHHHADAIVSLHLSRNPMIEIPSDFIQSCTALSKLYLSHMFLKRVPLSIRHSTTLTLLDLSSNRIASLEEGRLNDLPRLTTLHVQNNRLERLPHTLPRGLMDLNISNNKFSELPLAVTELANLTNLDISFNAIGVMPSEIGNLVSLVQLVMVGNNVSKLPSEFGKLGRLCELDCRRNQMVDCAVACVLPELVSLSADHNVLHGLTLTLGRRLMTLDVSHNDITELSVVSRLGASTACALTSLDVSSAQLSVLDDAVFTVLSSLRTLHLDRNKLHALPSTLGNLAWLATLSVADNQLSELPASIGRLQKLESLDVHGNSLRALPAEVWNCASLARLNATSNLLEGWANPPVPTAQGDDPPPLPESGCALLHVPSSPNKQLTFAPRRPSVSRTPSELNLPPLVHSLEALYLAENKLTDDALVPLMLLKELRALNLSLNAIQEIPISFFKRLTKLEELYLSGNQLTRFPGDALEGMGRLTTLFLNGNRLSHLPPELGRVKTLTHLDVGNNLLKYNINNLDYDWNWNFNKNLVFLNLSGNKQLEIKSDAYIHGRPSVSSLERERRALSGFSGLQHLRVLGLMDVTITTNTTSDIPDENDERRVRTSSSLVNGLSYGIADTLGRNRHHHMMDLVHEFRGIKKDTVFAMFGRALPVNQAAGTTSNSLAKFLKDNFIRVFIAQLSTLDEQRGEGVSDALRRAFLKLNQDYHDVLFGPTRKMSVAGPAASLSDASLLHTGASGIVVYILNKRLYVANAGNALAVVARRGTARVVSRKHAPYDRLEIARLRATGGWVSPPGLVNGELDISRSFGFYHLLPAVNARPDVFEYELTPRDDFIIIANRGLWDYVEFQTAVDIVRTGTEPMVAAQKLRDLAMSYGAEGSTMIMVVSLATTFKNQDAAKRKEEEEEEGEQWRERRPPAVTVIDRTLDRLPDVPPPTGHIAIVFTDIKGSTHLWQATAAGTITAIHLHNSLLRRFLRHCGGYEVRTEGDSFICAFPTVLAAVWWCLTIQVELLAVPWPQDILECADGRVVHDTQGRVIYRGLCVRMGIHYGSPLCLTDPVTNRMDYFGLVVTRASRISSIAAGGQIMCSADVLNEINVRVLKKKPVPEYSDVQPMEALDAIRMMGPEVVEVGEVKLKGLESPETLSYLLPNSLVARKDYRDTGLIHPSIIGANFIASPYQIRVAQIRDLAKACIGLELAIATVGHRSEDSLQGLPLQVDVLLPPDMDKMTQSDLLTILYSLMVRIENIEVVLRSRSLTRKDALLAAFRELDERTLEQLFSMTT